MKPVRRSHIDPFHLTESKNYQVVSQQVNKENDPAAKKVGTRKKPTMQSELKTDKS